MGQLTRIKNAVVVAVFCILLAGNVVSMEKNEYCFVAEEVETENVTTEMQEQAIEPEYQYPIILTPSVGDIAYTVQSEDIFLICSGDSMYGYIKKSGEEITGYIYEFAYPFSEGLACVNLDGKYGYIDTNGEVVLPLVYDDATPFSEGLAYFVKDDKYGFMNPDGSIAFLVGYDSVSSFHEGLSYFCIDGKYGYMDRQGNTVIAPVFDDVDYFEDGLAYVTQNGGKGVIDKHGNVVVPMKYTRMFRNENGIMAIIGEEASQYDYYDFDGNLITEEEYKASKEQENDTGLTGLYNYDTDMFQVLNEHGEVVLEVECSWAYYYIYHDFDNYVLCHYEDGENDQIAVVKENEMDLSDMLLVNSITPKIKPYWDVLRGDIEVLNEDGSKETVWGFCRGISGCEYYYDRMDNRKIKLYDIEQSGTPLMYCYEEEYVDWGYSMSNSALYALRDGKLSLVITGEEGGGSGGGEYVCFFKDEESGEILIGTDGWAGGFGGRGYSSSLYNYQYGELEELLSCWWMYQPTRYYSDTELKETPHLFYDEENKPYTADTIWESEIASIFEINGEKVTMEEYDMIRLKYSFFSLYGYM